MSTTTEATTAQPSFSIGTTDSTTTPAAAVPTRRSTRRAALTASLRITEDLAPQRRSTRLSSRATTTVSAASGSATGRSRGSDRTAASSPVRSNAPRGARGTKETPIVLDDEEIDEMDLKPAARSLTGVGVASSSAASATSGTAQKPPEDFTCAICLDAPNSMVEVASISGCTHQFCFDCIDKWAETENKCPCCKSRFRTIDRAVALPPTPEVATPGRRGKRKRAATASSGGSNARARRGGAGSGASPRSTRRVNSRTVEDRNQQTVSAFPINQALVEQILASVTSLSGNGPGQVTFGMSEDGRPHIRMIRPHGGGMVGVMEMFLPEHGDGPPAHGGSPNRLTRVTRGSGAARGSAAAASVAAGSSSSPTRTARVRFSRARSSPGSSVDMLFPSRAGRSATTAAASTRPGSAGGSARSASASAIPRASNSRAARQSTSSAFASLFASMREGRETREGLRNSPHASRRGSSTGGGRAAAAAASSAGGVEDGAAAEAPAGSNRLTIRFITQERASGPGSSSGSGRSRSSRSPSTSTSRRPAGPGGSAGGAGRGGTDDEPIVID